MASLHVFVFLMGLVALAHSACVHQMLALDFDPETMQLVPEVECKDKDEKYPIGCTWWRDNARTRCSCDKQGLECCTHQESIKEIPEGCEMKHGNFVDANDHTKKCVKCT